MKTVEIFNNVVTYEKDLIPIAPLCDLFHLDKQNQQKKIQNDPVFKKNQGKNLTFFGQIEKNRPILLNRKGFLRWIQIINPKTVHPDLQEAFIQFQTDVFDFFYGKADEEARLRLKYKQLKKMEAAKRELEKRIRQNKNELQQHLDTKFGQRSIAFNEKTLTE